MNKTGGSRDGAPGGKWPWSGFPAALIAIPVVIVSLGSGVLVSRSSREFGTFLAIVLAGCAGGAFAGFLVGAPGLESGDTATVTANKKGWADRLGVFGNWVTGAAFVLVVANAGEIADWFASMTRTLADTNSGQGDDLYQYSLGAVAIAAAMLGFTIGFMQMVTTGRQLIGAAAKAEAAAEEAAASAVEAAAAASEVRAAKVAALSASD